MRIEIAAIAFLLAASGCGGHERATSDPDQPAPESSLPSEASITSPIVGSWERVMTCDERVAALQEAGLGQFAAEHVAGNEMVPGVSFDEPELIDPDKPCKGAVPRKHGHFFTSDGSFGSTDHRGEQVDKGTFELRDDQTIVITNEDATVIFDFRIENGELFLDPVVPSCVTDGCWGAQWAVAVASPGRPWSRAD